MELNDKFVNASALSKVQDDLLTATEISVSSGNLEGTGMERKFKNIEPLKIEDFKKKLTSFQNDILKQLVNSTDKIYRQPSSIFKYNEFNEFRELITLKILKRAHPSLNSYILTDEYLGLTADDLK